MLDLSKIESTIVLMEFENPIKLDELIKHSETLPESASDRMPSTYVEKNQTIELVQGTRTSAELFGGWANEPVSSVYFNIKTTKRHPILRLIGKKDTVDQWYGLDLLLPTKETFNRGVAVCHGTLREAYLGGMRLSAHLEEPFTYQRKIISHILEKFPGDSEVIKRNFEFGNWLQQ